MIMLLVSFPFVLLSNAIFSHNKQQSLAGAYAFGIVANIIFNILLVPRFGAVGSAFATFISTTIITIIVWRKMKKINYFEVFPDLKKILSSSALMAVSILLLNYLGISVILNILISSLLYVGVLLLFKEPILRELGTIVRK